MGGLVAKRRKDQGFILIILLSLLLLLAVTAMSLNVQSGMQVRMAANRTIDAQTYLDQLAVIEQSLWKLTGDPSWRVPAGEDYAYRGRMYNRRVFGPNAVAYPALAAYADAVIVSVQAPNATRTVNKSFRRHIDTPFLIRKPVQVCVDGAGNIYFADIDNHSVWRIDALTGAIIRVAGTGKSGFSGDGGPAREAQLFSPAGIAADAAGNLYIADTNNHRIRKFTVNGNMSTVAGTGGGGYNGEGLATAAQLFSPAGVAVDATGNLYIADTENHRIRKVTMADGMISTIVNTAGYQTDGTHPPGDGGTATAATLNRPWSVFVDSALDIFVADRDNHRIRKVTSGTGMITTVVNTSGNQTDGTYPLGDGGAATAATLNRPCGVWVDAAGAIFIADSGNHRIRKVTVNTGIIITFAGTGTAGYGGDGGPATYALLDSPAGICVKITGEVIISDTSNTCLRQVGIANGISTLPMTVGPGLTAPRGTAPYDDTVRKKLFLYIADSGNHRIRKLDTTTNLLVTVAGTGSAGYLGDGGQATAAQINSPSAVAVDPSGNLYIADTENHRIRKVTAIGGAITDRSCSSNCSIISTVAGTGSAGYSGDGGSATLAAINGPEGVFVNASEDIFISDTVNHRVRVVKKSNNVIRTVAGTGTAGYSGDGGNAVSAQVNAPRGIFVDINNDLYIADTNNHRIRKVRNSNNIITTLAGTGSGGYSGDGGAATAAQLSGPRAVSADGAGNLYIADTGNHRLRIVNHDAAPVIATMAGTGAGGYNGDSQPAAQASLNAPSGVALGLTRGGGRIFIGDTGNNRIRMLFLKTEKHVYGP